MNQNAASAQAGTLHDQVWWSALPSVTPVTGQFSEQRKEIAKGRLTLNSTGWARTYLGRTALWQPYSKNHQLHPLQVKQKQEQHCNKLSRSPKTEKHAAALLKIISPSCKQRHLSSKQRRCRQLTTSSSCSTLASETGEFNYSSHKEQVGSVHALTFGCVKERCMLSCAGCCKEHHWFQVVLMRKTICTVNVCYMKLVWKQSPLQRTNEIYWISFLFQLSW